MIDNRDVIPEGVDGKKAYSGSMDDNDKEKWRNYKCNPMYKCGSILTYSPKNEDVGNKCTKDYSYLKNRPELIIKCDNDNDYYKYDETENGTTTLKLFDGKIDEVVRDNLLNLDDCSCLIKPDGRDVNTNPNYGKIDGGTKANQ
ncbi:hypothetical protein JO84_gp216 [Aureococcus anophagefferens virus]|uniref:Uncharacterized protein n=1 Tax=Aureococcus anophagefferens virus TaxID=1474867 RepID=A0A076FGM5_9VIRU|nr:hypothetical protein JO84_gp216 [Aureococcus anophagefferens virus]AII17240.1 hypothetical protein AaV_259 [Aureococcus anophagefferens virus]UOG94172.1 hypothetical protein MKD35_131 [Aureococcus anophagefferens virus]